LPQKGATTACFIQEESSGRIIIIYIYVLVNIKILNIRCIWKGKESLWKRDVSEIIKLLCILAMPQLKFVVRIGKSFPESELKAEEALTINIGQCMIACGRLETKTFYFSVLNSHFLPKTWQQNTDVKNCLLIKLHSVKEPNHFSNKQIITSL
jgi:hypothetical protein